MSRQRRPRAAAYGLCIAPFQRIRPGLVFQDRAQAAEYARQENKYGEYRGRGVKVLPLDASGSPLCQALPDPSDR